MVEFMFGVVIIVYNVVCWFVQCFDVFVFVDDIVVVDGGSIDDIVEIVCVYGVWVIVVVDWLGFGLQKNCVFVVLLMDWVLLIDIDEVVLDEFVVLICVVLCVLQVDVYVIDWLLVFCGSWVYYSGWYLDWILCLFW